MRSTFSERSMTGPVRAWPLSKGFNPVPLGRIERSLSKLRECGSPSIRPCWLRILLVVLRKGVAAARVWQCVQQWTRKRLVVLASVGRPHAIVVRAVIRAIRTVGKTRIILSPCRGCANYQHRCHKRRSAKIFEFASHYAPPVRVLLHGAFAATLTGSAAPRIPY